MKKALMAMVWIVLGCLWFFGIYCFFVCMEKRERSKLKPDCDIHLIYPATNHLYDLGNTNRMK